MAWNCQAGWQKNKKTKNGSIWREIKIWENNSRAYMCSWAKKILNTSQLGGGNQERLHDKGKLVDAVVWMTCKE